MSKIKTQFKCSQVSSFEHGQVVKLDIVPHGAEANKSVSPSHASGELQLRIDKSAAAINFFVPGEEYTLEFAHAKPTVVEPKGKNVN